MAKQDDVTSTEKLLNVIRSKKDEAPPPSGAPETLPQKPSYSPSPAKTAIPMQKSSTVGIDIGHEYLRLVQAVKSSDGKWRVIKRRRLTLPETSRNTPEFSAFLKASLASFCESAKQSNLWVSISAAGVDVRHIRIPKVPRKQIANSVYWTVRKEMPFDEKDLLLDFEVQGEIVEKGVPRLSVMVYTIPRREIEVIRDLFSGIGWPLTGISIVPFSMQNLFRTGWIPAIEESVSCIFIGNDFSRIDIFTGGNLVMTRGIKAGANSMVEAVVESFNLLKRDRATPAITVEQGRKIVHSLSPDSPPLRATTLVSVFGKRKSLR